MHFFKELYSYRELLKTNIKKEIRGRYKGSFLGIVWSFVNPLLMTLVYALVFPYLMRGSMYEHYTTFLVIGILPWNWFVTSIAQSSSIFLANAGIIKKVYFPREILPISVVTSGMINYCISCLVIVIFLIASGIGFSFQLLWIPVIMLVQYLFTLGIVFITSAVNVYVRDLEYIVNFFVQMLFYGTPILYSLDMFAGTSNLITSFININPMSTIINSYRNVFYWKTSPEIFSLFVVMGCSVMMCLVGLIIFKKLSKGFAEEV